MRDMFINLNDTHQFLDPSSFQPYNYKKGIPYSQVLRFNTICSDNESFDKLCNNLEGWLMKRGYNGKMMRKQILRAREHLRNHLLQRGETGTSGPNIWFNLTYYPVF